MRALMLVPHADDETLFASHVIDRFDPEIALVYLPRDMDEQVVRVREFHAAVAQLGGKPVYNWLGGYEGEPIPDLEEKLRELEAGGFDYVFAPHPIADGHAEHNLVGHTAEQVWPSSSKTLYHTYTRVGGRTRAGKEYPLTTDMVVRKLRALAEYRSQIDHPARRPWFTTMLDLREWYESS